MDMYCMLDIIWFSQRFFDALDELLTIPYDSEQCYPFQLFNECCLKCYKTWWSFDNDYWFFIDVRESLFPQIEFIEPQDWFGWKLVVTYDMVFYHKGMEPENDYLVSVMMKSKQYNGTSVSFRI